MGTRATPPLAALDENFDAPSGAGDAIATGHPTTQ